MHLLYLSLGFGLSMGNILFGPLLNAGSFCHAGFCGCLYGRSLCTCFQCCLLSGLTCGRLLSRSPAGIRVQAMMDMAEIFNTCSSLLVSTQSAAVTS